MSDPSLIASNSGAAVFSRLVELPFRLAAVAAYVGYGALRLPRLLRSMSEQRARLAHREPIDDSHYRWFTKQNTEVFLGLFGEVEELVMLPNTNHSMAMVRIRK